MEKAANRGLFILRSGIAWDASCVSRAVMFLCVFVLCFCGGTKWSMFRCNKTTENKTTKDINAAR
jgi:hypothetical protein